MEVGKAQCSGVTPPNKDMAHVTLPSATRIEFWYLISFRFSSDSVTNRFSILMILFNVVSLRLVFVTVLDINSLWRAVYLGMSCY